MGICVALVLSVVGNIAFKQTLGTRVVEALGLLLSGWRGHLWVIILEHPVRNVRWSGRSVGSSWVLIIGCCTGLARLPEWVDGLTESVACG